MTNQIKSQTIDTDENKNTDLSTPIDEMRLRLDRAERLMQDATYRMQSANRRARAMMMALGLVALIGSVLLDAHPAALAQAPGVTLSQLVSEISALQTTVANIQNNQKMDEGNFSTLQNTVNKQGNTLSSLQNTVNSQGSTLTGLQTTVKNLQTTVINQGKITGLFSLSSGVGTNTELTLTGVNLHIVNGEGSTGKQDGLGNLIVGYNETRGDGTDVRTGSHNIVTGHYNNFSSFGGIIGGSDNSLRGQEAFCVGDDNTVSVLFASISGGQQNVASAQSASVSGGGLNEASGNIASVSGGLGNASSGQASSISGGFGLSANGSYDYNSSNVYYWDGKGPTWAGTTYNGH